MKPYFLFLSCLLFILPPSFALMLQSVMKNYMAEEMTSYMSEKISDFAHSRELAVESMFKFLPKKLNYTCDVNDIAYLRNPKYYTLYIRIIGIVTNNINCSSSGVGGDREVFDHALKDYVNGYYALPTPSGGNEYVILFKSSKGILYAILNNAWIEPLLSTVCESCFTVSMLSHINESYVSIRKGDGVDNTLVESSELSSQHLVITVTATKKLLNLISIWYARYIYSISFLLGGILSITFYLIVRRPLSHQESIARALKLNEFIPYYQPIVDSSSNKVVGAEVLVRWRLPNGKIIPPSSFISDVEADTGMLLRLTTQLIDQVCKDKLKIKYQDPLWFSINIGAGHFSNNVLLEYMKSIRDLSDGISFEITERQPLHDLFDVAKYVDNLKLLGHKIKIDDFGVGYGGFSYLQKINVDSIKIDKMFIDTIDTSDIKKNILESIISMAHEHSYEVIAEGVETRPQVEYLKSKGITLIQGYYYSAPVSFDGFLKLLKCGF